MIGVTRPTQPPFKPTCIIIFSVQFLLLAGLAVLQVIIFIMELLKANGRISGVTGEKCDAENTCAGITYLLLNYNL